MGGFFIDFSTMLWDTINNAQTPIKSYSYRAYQVLHR